MEAYKRCELPDLFLKDRGTRRNLGADIPFLVPLRVCTAWATPLATVSCVLRLFPVPKGAMLTLFSSKQQRLQHVRPLPSLFLLPLLLPLTRRIAYSFIVIASTTDYARKILNSSTLAEPCLVRSAKQVLLRASSLLPFPIEIDTDNLTRTAENWVFLNGKVHNEYRKGLNCLFTPQALECVHFLSSLFSIPRSSVSSHRIYLKMQDAIYRRYFAEWVANPNPKAEPYQMKFRDLNMETSLRVFCGSYIAEDSVQEISDKYWLITQALELVNFPFAFPGTKVWNACKAREIAVKHLKQAAADAKKAVRSGKEPDCLLDEWVQEIDKKKAREFTDKEMALVLLSFIFASQGPSSIPPLPSFLPLVLTLFLSADAMSSSITFAFQLLADHPEILAKVRAEQVAVRGDDTESSLSLAWLEQMPYTNAVTKEVLRYRPPVIMVPYLTKKPFPINDEYTVPKGTMLIPSFWNVRPPLPFLLLPLSLLWVVLSAD